MGPRDAIDRNKNWFVAFCQVKNMGVTNEVRRSCQEICEAIACGVVNVMGFQDYFAEYVRLSARDEGAADETTRFQILLIRL
jgi:hypothetical protein